MSVGSSLASRAAETRGDQGKGRGAENEDEDVGGELETPGLEGTIDDFLDSFLAEGMENDDLLGSAEGDEGLEAEDELQVQEVVREVAAVAPAKGLTKQRLAAVLKSLEDS